MKNRLRNIQVEFKKLLTKEILLYFVFLQLAGIFVFALIYSNRVGLEYPVAIVDLENNATSRMAIAAVDNAPELKVIGVFHSMAEGMAEVTNERALALLNIPRGFYSGVLNKQVPHFRVYVDCRNLVTANSVFTGLKKTLGTLLVGSKLKLMNKYFPLPDRLAKIMPVRIVGRPLGNPGVDYFLFMLTMFFVMLIQQCVLVGSSLGLARENEFHTLDATIREAGGPMRYLWSRFAAIMVIQAIILVFSCLAYYWVLGIHSRNLAVSLLYLLVFSAVVTWFSQFIGLMFRKRIHVLQLLVFISVPALMASGYTYPLESFPTVLRRVAALLPSTPMLNVFPRLTTLSGSAPFLWHYLLHLGILFVLYFILAWGIIKLKSWRVGKLERKTVI